MEPICPNGAGSFQEYVLVQPTLTSAGLRPRVRWGRLLAYAFVALGIGYGAYVGGRYAWGTYHFRRAQEAVRRHDFAGAEAELAQCRWAWPADPDTWLLSARTARRDRKYDEADRFLAAYEKMGGAREEVVLERTLARVQRGETGNNRDRQLLAFVDKGLPETPLILEALAQGYVNTFRLVEAGPCLDRLVAVEPENGDAYVLRGWIREQLGHIDEARADYERGLELSPNNDFGRICYAESLLRWFLWDEAAPHFEEYLRRHPGNGDATLGLAACYRQLNRPDEAARLLEPLIAQSPPSARALAEKGRLAVSRGQDTEAERWFTRAVERLPHDRLLNSDLYLCLSRQGKKEEAAKRLAVLTRIEQDGERLQTLQLRLNAEPKDLDAACDLVELLIRNGRGFEAKGYLDGVLQRAPEHARARELAAKYATELRQRPESR